MTSVGASPDSDLDSMGESESGLKSGLRSTPVDSDSTLANSDSSAVDSDSGLMDLDSDSTQVDSDSQWVQVSPVKNIQGIYLNFYVQ